MSTTLPDEPYNPYTAPLAEIGTAPPEALNEFEAIRQAHIKHEASVKAVGLLNYLGGFLSLLAAIVMVGLAAGNMVPMNANGDTTSMRVMFVGVGVFLLVFSILGLAVADGLRRLQPWSRWTELVLMSLQALLNVIRLNPFGALISGYIIYLMTSSKSTMVFSPYYKEVIAQTPHIRYRSSMLVKILLVILAAAVGGAFYLGLRR